MSAATLVLSFRLNTSNAQADVRFSTRQLFAGLRTCRRETSLNCFSINHMSMVTPPQVKQSTCETTAMPCISIQCNYYETVQEAITQPSFLLAEQRVASTLTLILRPSSDDG
jgi:hypothetical protein